MWQPNICKSLFDKAGWLRQLATPEAPKYHQLPQYGPNRRIKMNQNHIKLWKP